VQQTQETDEWGSRPSETPTQIGDPMSAVRSMPGGEGGTGVMSGQTIGDRYRVVRKIGAGGMGEVWEAKHIVINKAVAVKVLTLDPTLTNGAEQAERLMREARVVASIRHDNVVDITDFGHTPQGAPYFVMELLRGETLKDIIKNGGPMQWERARDVLIQLTDAMAAAHEKGVIHRDIKPDNVFLVNRGGKEVAKIIDFGIAKTTILGEEGRTLTQTGMVCGTPAFMSPEQARGERIDERTDIYSLGCLAYQMLAGRQPFEANSAAEALYQQLFVEPTSMTQVVPAAGIPPSLDAIVLTAMRKNRNLRFQSMEDVSNALQSVNTQAMPITIPAEQIPEPPKEAQERFATSEFSMMGHERPDSVVAGSSGGTGIMVAGLVAVLLAGAGGAGYYALSTGLLGGSTAEAEVEAPADEAEAVPADQAEQVGEALGEPAEVVAGADEAAAVPEGEGDVAEAAAAEAVAVPTGGTPRRGSSGSSGKNPVPIYIPPNPVYEPKDDHVADGQGPDPLPAPPDDLPDAEPDPQPAPEPVPEPEPKDDPPPKPPDPPPDDGKKDKNGKKVDDLRDPWERD
jgi:serine/threonine-protein kinase